MAKVMTHKKQLLNELGDVTNAQVLDYGCGAGAFDEKDLQLWRSDLQLKSDTGHYYFAIDLNVAVLG